MTKPKMIIVEDDLKLQRMLKDYFVTQDFDVSTLDDGSNAAQTILAEQPDIVLLDLMLPVTDGLTICRQTRTLFKERCPFTGNTSKYFSNGGDMYPSWMLSN